ncbi:MAG: hypothetical protein DCF25_10165 [Leptolyngbya foveolarum]|uniref:Uncharacterized protein n=1 Tax=Leptolyngbya foveolarum TaxID=47253 RepID=A0A2W4W7P4_9CYAN|nr:MAG: hypothetical protein DCF25_10165 [Leptolyngbya foveolarum]
MFSTDLAMPREDIEAIVFWLVEYNEWKAAPLSSIEPATSVEGIPINRAQQMFEGNQLEMAISHSDIQKLFNFFSEINDGNRLYSLNGFLKHPDLHKSQPAFFGISIDGPRLKDEELDKFSKQFKTSAYTLQNRSDNYGSGCFYADWDFPSWLPSEMIDPPNPDGIPDRIPDKSYIKWKGQELPQIR